jgi:hypothetical protein
LVVEHAAQIHPPFGEHRWHRVADGLFTRAQTREDCGVLLGGGPRASGFAVDSGHRQLGLNDDTRKI